jgi:hypothetical protein
MMCFVQLSCCGEVLGRFCLVNYRGEVFLPVTLFDVGFVYIGTWLEWNVLYSCCGEGLCNDDVFLSNIFFVVRTYV